MNFAKFRSVKYLVVSCFSLTCVVVASLAAAEDQSAAPPERLCSPSGKFCLQIVPEKGHTLYELEDATLVVSSGKKVLAKYPTFGFPIDAFWSEGEKYVAFNNRRANGGDYLWIISLGDGKALKLPSDLAETLHKKELGQAKGQDGKKTMAAIQKICATCSLDSMRKEWLIATGWKSPTELKVLEEFNFFKMDGWFAVTRTYRITDHQVVMTDEKIAKTQESVMP